MRIGPSPRRTQALIAAVVIAAPSLAGAAPVDRYYERSFVLAANARCGLFQPQLTAALTAATWQARGAALRAGGNAPDLAETAQRARTRAATTRCDSADLKTVSSRVRDAFAGWSRVTRMNFPGERAGWSADRAAYARPTWRLMQGARTGVSPVRFGVIGRMDRPDQMAAVVSWQGRSRPTAVRIILRDANVAPRPWLARELPPVSQRRSIWAAGVEAADAGLLVEGRKAGQVWLFPAAAADAVSALDPREIFVVEFLFRDGSVARSSFETGDFAAGRAFLSMGRT
ncbi:hypothetical protein [Brevundimonas sp. SL130]|uniref:hypothetical protein n=1 Tax=Brevundimonas sp. SL130 TaxID=2995143 RepID=UPI00226C8A45|nr:hypothetical protein [Brevundimonas sp. SL130]WAC59466.1 hypothetical protein OU998_14795 [Brevundimonas sp. SL130]